MGSYENPWNSFHMISSSPILPTLTIGFVFTVTAYNMSAIYVTSYLSSIWHAILDNFRPITVWGLDLLIYYQIYPGAAYGEKWISPGSYIQLSGFFVLLLGTAMYNGDLGPLTSLFGEYQAIGEGDEKPIEVAMSSPALSRSPLLRAKAMKEEEALLNKKEALKNLKSGGGARKYAQDI